MSMAVKELKDIKVWLYSYDTKTLLEILSDTKEY